MITHDDVRHVARLARLKLDEDELDRYVGQLSSIVGHIDRIGELKLEEVPPTTRPLELDNVMREDERRPSLERAEVLKNGPEVENGAFRVPQIIQED